MLKIDEASSEAGLSSVFLRFEGGEFALVSDDGSYALPDGALDAVMAKFGGPLDPAERVVTVAKLELTPGSTLRHVRHLSGYDVIARDYLIYETPGAEPLCALATTIAAALAHLGRAVRRVHPFLAMRYTARVHRTPTGFSAECIELEALGEGSTREAAVRSLKDELEDQLSHVEGMAPPAVATAIAVDLVILDDVSE